MTDPEYKYLTYESLDEGAIVRIMLQEACAIGMVSKIFPADGHADRRGNQRLADEPAGAAGHAEPRRCRGSGELVA